LLDEFAYTHEQAAQAIGRSRSATSNLLRLLNLADPVQTMLLAGDIDMGHARALLALDRATQTMLAQQIVQKQLSVRDAERLVAKAMADTSLAAHSKPAPPIPAMDRDLLRLQETLSDALATDVKVEPGKKGAGKLVITYTSLENFEGLLARLGVSAEQLKERN
jgi:ParB family transcriptional regulator, chromosome partitioning protein